MSGDESIPAEDLVALIRRLRKPHPLRSDASEALQNYVEGVNWGRGMAARCIEDLLETYGMKAEEGDNA